jgi:hypothetical protein
MKTSFLLFSYVETTVLEQWFFYFENTWEYKKIKKEKEKHGEH